MFIHRRALWRRSARDYICTYVRGDSMYPILLISENPAYEIESVRDADAVIGRVVGVWQSLA